MSRAFIRLSFRRMSQQMMTWLTASIRIFYPLRRRVRAPGCGFRKFWPVFSGNFGHLGGLGSAVSFD